jgi:hypothetical protein
MKKVLTHSVLENFFTAIKEQVQYELISSIELHVIPGAPARVATITGIHKYLDRLLIKVDPSVEVTKEAHKSVTESFKQGTVWPIEAAFISGGLSHWFHIHQQMLKEYDNGNQENSP